MCSTKMLYKPEGRKKKWHQKNKSGAFTGIQYTKISQNIKTTSLVICRSALCRDAAAGAFCNAELDAKPT